MTPLLEATLVWYTMTRMIIAIPNAVTTHLQTRKRMAKEVNDVVDIPSISKGQYVLPAKDDDKDEVYDPRDQEALVLSWRLIHGSLSHG